MGCDGGVIATKRKFMRHGNTKPQDPKADANVLLLKRVTTCALSDEPLREPIVACELGNLYNKDALLQRLIDKTLPEEFSHIKSLRDLVTCNFTVNSGASGEASASSSGLSNLYFICPITKVEFSGRQPFVVLRGCGCVLSDKAIREVRSTECLVCNKPILSEDTAIVLAPPLEHIESIKKLMLERRERLKKEKKLKKKAHSAEEPSGTAVKGSKGKRKVVEPDNQGKKAPKIMSSATGKAVKEAMNLIESEKSRSAVYSSLFKKPELKNPNDLMMTVGGMRGTLA